MKTHTTLLLTTIAAVVLLTSSCTTAVSYKPTGVVGIPKAIGAPIDVYYENTIIHRPFESVGKVKVGDTGFTMVGGSLEEVIETVKKNARKAGADAIKITSVKPPDIFSTIYRVSAVLIRYTINDNWEKIDLREEDFVKYIEDGKNEIDPIEGIWVDSEQMYRIAIKRDNSKLSIDFTGYILDVSDKGKSVGWVKGFKKLEVVSAAKSGVYILKYFASDFSEHGETVVLGKNGIINIDLKFQNFAPIKMSLIKTFPKKSASIVKNPNTSNKEITIDSIPDAFGSGFAVGSNGYVVTNEHVVNKASQVFVYVGSKRLPAVIVKTDTANDLALLKVDSELSSLPVSSSRGVKLGATVFTVGFPNPELQGKSPKLTKGEISSLSGAGDDPKYFQISVPVQPGNSGGPLVDAYGNVVGVVTAKLRASTALAKSGSLPENVNYAVKGTYVMGFLESVPKVAAEMLDPKPRRSREFTEVVSEAEKASVMILVYE